MNNKSSFLAVNIVQLFEMFAAFWQLLERIKGEQEVKSLQDFVYYTVLMSKNYCRKQLTVEHCEHWTTWHWQFAPSILETYGSTQVLDDIFL